LYLYSIIAIEKLKKARENLRQMNGQRRHGTWRAIDFLVTKLPNFIHISVGKLKVQKMQN
jgi:hypothetical protein